MIRHSSKGVKSLFVIEYIYIINIERIKYKQFQLTIKQMVAKNTLAFDTTCYHANMKNSYIQQKALKLEQINEVEINLKGKVGNGLG